MTSSSTSSPHLVPRAVMQCVLPDEAATNALGIALGELVVARFTTPQIDDGANDGEDDGSRDGGFTIHLSGDLGAGKTTLVRALLRHLGVEGRVKSPTYTLVEPYVVELPDVAEMPKGIASRQRMNLYCYHFDFYRFEDPHEWLDAGFRDYFSDAALRLVEWPERAVTESGSLLPVPDLHVTLETRGEGRFAIVEAASAQGAQWLTRVDLAALLEGPRRPRAGASSKRD